MRCVFSSNIRARKMSTGTASALGTVAAFVCVIVFGAGCGTLPVRNSGRMGLFAYLKTLEPEKRKSASSGEPRAGRTVDDRKSRTASSPARRDGNFSGMREPASSRRLKAETRDWVWPLRKVHLTSEFGRRGRRFHEGIDLRAPAGTEVFSVAAGKVIYADNRIGGYGNMVIISHSSGLHTIYAHNSRLHVRTGQSVTRGQKIALSGNTGHSTGPHLHFELRSGVIAVNPIPWLPVVVNEQRKGRTKRTLASSR
jgi:murein DD-endopeptidase MepM/ murein hydrolase activator NlpD